MRPLIALVTTLLMSSVGAHAETATELFNKAQKEANNAVRASLLDQTAARVDAGDAALDIPAAALRSEAEMWRGGVRETGAFMLFWTDGGKFIAGQYWLAPDVRLTFYPVAPSQRGGRQTIFLDRGFLPRRMIYLKTQTDWTYEPELALPMTYRFGDVHPIMLAARHTDEAGATMEKRGAARITLNRRVDRTISLDPVTGYSFTLDAGAGPGGEELRRHLISSTEFELEGRAVYIPQWDAMFDEATFTRIRSVTQGTVLNSAIFQLFATFDVGPSQLARCFLSVPREKLEAQAAEYRRDHDERAAELFRTGNPAFSAFWSQGQRVRDYQSELSTTAIPCMQN